MQKKQVPLPDLKPCPFCGSTPEYFYSRISQIFSVACFSEACPFVVKTHDFPTLEQAVEVWNKRAEQ